MKHRNQKKKYFSLASAGRTADIFIFGDITSWEWLESDVSSYTLARAVQDLEADQINVHINSYGGEVKEGLAIYNALRALKARVKTVCDGMACSIASVIFMAGDERVMHEASLLMIHNAWASGSGNAAELRKQAEEYFQERIRNLTADAIAKAETVNDIRLVSITGVRMPDVVKGIAFGVRQQSPEKTAFIAATVDMGGKPLLTVAFTDDLVKEGLNASAIVREAAKAIKGGGGGQPGFAQAGGKDKDGIAQAFQAMHQAICK